MLNRVRTLQISLAAKCQLLFGAAVVLIISAALFVPWHRMEQLTEQLNQRSARTLSEYAVNDHVAHAPGRGVLHARVPARPAALEEPPTREPARPTDFPASQPAPATQEGSATQPAATQPQAEIVAVTPPTTTPSPVAPDPYPPPRLILLDGKTDDDRLTTFERWAAQRLLDRPSRESIARTYEMPDGREGYRYARLDTSCVQCHAPTDVAAGTTRPSAPVVRPVLASTTGPATAPGATEPLYGLVVVDMPSQVETNQVLLNRVFILSAGLLAGTLAIIVFYLITTRLILQPVRVLQETAEKVSEGDLNIRSDISTGDEFQQLSETFNVMLANLQENADQLRAVNKSLDLRLGQLAESNVALYESNRLKSEFLANVSHELRTPLNSILGFADLLKDSNGVAADAKATRYLQNILRSGRNLLDLINDLLDLAKIEAGRMDVRAEPLSLNDLFEGLTSLLKPLLEPKRLTLASSVGPDVPILQTDPAKLQQVLYNFLSNAIKFSPPDGRIDLVARVEGKEKVRLSVVDRGPGVPPDKHDIIFEKFRQVDASVTREHGGTGLGLAISKELTALLGGTIGVDATPGGGATFWIVIPTEIEAGAQEVGGKLVLT